MRKRRGDSLNMSFSRLDSKFSSDVKEFNAGVFLLASASTDPSLPSILTGEHPAESGDDSLC